MKPACIVIPQKLFDILLKIVCSVYQKQSFTAGNARSFGSGRFLLVNIIAAKISRPILHIFSIFFLDISAFSISTYLAESGLYHV